MKLSRLAELDSLSNMDNSSIKQFCETLRENIIEYTSKNGGYLSSNLSSVEIAVMLKKLFNNDRIILCGEDLELINQYLELSDCSASINTLSSALGQAISRDINNADKNIVALINSDYLRSGKAIESLNQIGIEKRKMIIVFNDDTAINQGISMVNRFVSTLRNTKAYNSIKTNVKGAISNNKNGEKLIEDIHNIKSSIKKTVIDEGIFGEYGIDYIGPVNGHNISELSRAFEVARTKEYPVVVHCISTSGKGYKLAENSSNETWHKVDKFDIKTGRSYAGEVEGYLFPKHIVANELNKCMMTNDRIVIISNNIYQDGVSLLFGQYTKRCISSSSKAISLEIACGISNDDSYPYVCLNMSDIKTCLEQLYRYVINLNKPMLISIINDTDNLSLLKSIKGLNITVINDENGIKNAVHDFSSKNSPTVIVLPKTCIESK